MSAAYRFLPWVRQGIAHAVRTPDAPGARLPSRASIEAELVVNDREVSVPVRLFGPGDVTGLDSGEVVRTEPSHLAIDFEPNYFPAIEFDRPDFPWLFTPAAAHEKGRLRPWLVLVVVREQPGVTLRASAQRPLPVLTIEAPARPAAELPDLAESWAWAHAQVVLGEGETVEDLLTDAHAERNLSRLLCARRLRPRSRYRACVVPAFEAGRLAGLGLAADGEAELAPAWLSAADAPLGIELPVYHQWEFGTGAGGDFESLVRRLAGRPVPPGLGTRAMKVADLPFDLPDLGIVRLGGALRAPGTRTGILPDEFKEPLRALLNLPAGEPPESDPLVAPPVYGRWQAWHPSVPEYGERPRWLRGLNLDPRRRAAAGVGVLVVQDQQEELMAAAWEQLGDVEAVNQARRQAQLAQEVGRSLHQKHLRRMDADRIFQFVAPLQARVRLSPDTLERTLRRHRVPRTVSSTTFRRVTRPRGALVRRLAVPDAPPGHRPIRPAVHGFFTRVVAGLPIISPQRIDGMVSADEVSAQVERLERAVGIFILTGGPQGRRAGRNLLAAARPWDAYLGRVKSLTTTPRAPTPFFLDVQRVGELRATVLERLDPAVTVPARLSVRLRGAAGEPVPPEEATDPLAPMPHPEFPRPMYEALRDLSQDLLMPGLDQIPPETVTLLETDPRFIESFLSASTTR